MAKDPAFLFYSADFLIGTSFFTREEVGDYIRVLCHMHQVGGHMGAKDIRQVAPDVSEKVIKKFKKDENGLYYNERLLTELLKRQAFTESRLKNLNKGHVVSHMDAHMENENDNDNRDEDLNKNSRKGIVKGNGKDKPDLEAPILFLNEKASRRYDPKNKTNKTLIAARYKEGITLEDFKEVIDKKCRQWLNDPKMVSYLRPETLFAAGHFESYLNEPEKELTDAERIARIASRK